MATVTILFRDAPGRKGNRFPWYTTPSSCTTIYVPSSLPRQNFPPNWEPQYQNPYRASATAVRTVTSTEVTTSVAVPWPRPQWQPLPPSRPHPQRTPPHGCPRGHIHGSDVLCGPSRGVVCSGHRSPSLISSLVRRGRPAASSAAATALPLSSAASSAANTP